MSVADPSILAGLAEAQSAFLPRIPAEIFAGLVPVPPFPGTGRLAVDVGAGPGQSTRALRTRLGPDRPIVAIEPVQDMRRVLLRDLAADPDLQVLDCPAESLALPPGIAGLVLMADRFRQTDPRAFLPEAARILAPGGVLVLLRSRPVASGIVAALDARIDSGRNGTGSLAEAEATALPDAAAFSALGPVEFRQAQWSTPRDARGLIDLYLSDPEIWRSVRSEGLARLLPDLMAICADHGLGSDPADIAIQTRAILCRKAP